MIIQDILRSFADENVRQDFLDGTNGAVKIDQGDMNLLEKLYVEVNPKRPTRTDEPTFVTAANHSANTFSSVIDATKKTFADSTYEHVNGILKSIQECGYFEKNVVKTEEVPAEAEDGTTNSVSGGQEGGFGESKSDLEAGNQPIESKVVDQSAKTLPVIQAEPQLVAPVPQALPPQIVATGNFPPMPNTAVQVRAVEHGMYKQQQQQQQHFIHQKPVRPIHEVIGTPSFFFLQESEIDESNDLAQHDYQGNQVPLPQASPQQLHQQQLSSLTSVQSPVSSIQSQSQILSNQPPNLQAPVPGMVPVNPVMAPQQAGVPPMIPTQTYSSQSYPNLVQPMYNAKSLKSGADVTNIPPFVSPLQQPPQSLVIDQNQLGGLRTIPAFVQQQQNAQMQMAQMQNMIQSQQLAAAVNADTTSTANALTEKLKSTLQINDSKPANLLSSVVTSTASPDLNKDSAANDLNPTDWNEVNDQQSNEVNATSWSTEMDSTPYHSGGVTSGNSSYKRHTNNYNKYGDNKYSDNSYGGRSADKYSDNKFDKYSNSFRSRTYQNGSGPTRGPDGSGNFFYKNNNSYYSSNGNNNGGGNNMGFRPRMSGGNTGGNTDYNQRPQRPGPNSNNNGPQNNRSSGQDRDNRGIKA